MSPGRDTPTDHCQQLRNLWIQACEDGGAGSEVLQQHSLEHGCSPRMSDFYVADLQLLDARTASAAGAALDRCVAIAESVPDLRFFVVEDTLRLIVDAGPATGPIVVHLARRQIELRRRWSTLPCRREGRASTTVVSTD